MGEGDPGMPEDADFGRVAKVLRGETPDRTPYVEYWYVNQQVVEAALGRKMPTLDFWDDAITAADNFEFAQNVGMDAVTSDYIYRPNHVAGQSTTGDTFYAGGTIKSREDFEENIEPPPSPETLERKAKSYAEMCRKSNIGVVHSFTGVLDPAYLSMGMESFMLMLYNDPELVTDMMDHFLRCAETAMEIVCQYDEIDVILINDDVCIGTGSIISPKMMEELWKPRIEKLIRLPKARGKFLAYHSDGNIEPILPWLVEMGFCAVHPVEPYANDIYAVKKKWGDKITLLGNIDITLLRFGTPDEIRADVAEHIRRLGPERYIVSSSNSVIQDIPWENFRTMTETVRNS